MSNGRIYRAITGFQAVAAVQDLLSLTAPSTGVFQLVALYVSQRSEAGDSESEMLNIGLKWATGAFTIGSGGSVLTIDTPTGYSAPEVTARRNDTTQATGGVIQDVHREGISVFSGLVYKPLPKEIIPIAPTDALIVSIDTAPADSIDINVNAVFEELGGA